jgi:hypothetical protein
LLFSKGAGATNVAAGAEGVSFIFAGAVMRKTIKRDWRRSAEAHRPVTALVEMMKHEKGS